MTRRLLHGVGLSIVVLLLCASGVLAQKVVVRKFEGPRNAKVREALVQALDGKVELVEAAQAESIGDISTEDGRVAAATELGLSAFVEGKVDKGRNWTLTVTVYDGSDGGALGESRFSAKQNALPGKVKRNAWDALGPLIGQGSAPRPAPEPEPAPSEPEPEPFAQDEPEQDEDDEDEEDEEQDGVDDELSLNALDFTLGLRLQSRDFSYTDAFPGLRDYELGLSPMLYMEGHWYPGAHVTDGVAAWFGVELRAQFLVGTDSKNDAGETFPTSSSALGAALRFRVPLGPHELGLLAGYGTHGFSVDVSEGGVDPDIADVRYGFVRLGIDTRLVLGSLFRVEARVAYLPVLSLGGLQGRLWFPNGSGSGLEADLLFGIALVQWLELNAGVGMVRYGLSLEPEPTDPGVVGRGRVAGGALDQYYSLRFGVTLRL